MIQTSPETLLQIAISEAELGLKEGGIPIGAAIFDQNGNLLGKGHNKRIQDNDPSVHGETDAFKNAGRQKTYRDKILVTTLSPCWYCTGLIKQFKFGSVIIGENVNFKGGIEWLKNEDIDIKLLQSQKCIDMLKNYIANNKEIWFEDIGES